MKKLRSFKKFKKIKIKVWHFVQKSIIYIFCLKIKRNFSEQKNVFEKIIDKKYFFGKNNFRKKYF